MASPIAKISIGYRADSRLLYVLSARAACSISEGPSKPKIYVSRRSSGRQCTLAFAAPCSRAQFSSSRIFSSRSLRRRRRRQFGR